MGQSTWPSHGGRQSDPMVLGLVGLLLCCLLSPVAPSWSSTGLVINEFLADPEGSDSGREFVELFNPGPESVSLQGVALQFANGAAGAVWVTRWTASQDLTLAPGEYFLLVDRNWMGEQPGQAEVYLGLQNGPDALRLVRDALVLDLVGYGPLTDSAMMEGGPASIASGSSSARRPDGRDTGDNGSDFVLAEATPGAPNFHPHHFAVVDWNMDPPSADRPGIQVRFTLQIQNEGTEPYPVEQVELRAGGRQYPSHLDLTPPGAVRRLSWDLTPEKTGLHVLELHLPLPTTTDTMVLRPASLQVGPGDLVLHEVMAAPGHGQGEWLELAVRGQQPISLGEYQVRDEDGSWRALPNITLEPGELVVLAQDSLALAEWLFVNQAQGAITGCPAELAVSRQRNLSGWPSLNNTIPDSRDFSDRMYLANAAGDVIDHVTLDRESETGLSLERMADFPVNPGASNWATSTSLQGATPGCFNSVASTVTASVDFKIVPRILDPNAGTTTVHFLFSLSGGQSGWSLRVFDLWGCLVRDFGGDDLGPGPRDLPWNGLDDQGRPAGAGGYVALLVLRDSSHQVLAGKKILMAIR